METITRFYGYDKPIGLVNDLGNGQAPLRIKKTDLYDSAPGVYQSVSTDEFIRIHAARNDDYSLGDILDYLELGEFIEGIEEPGLELDGRELQQLIAMAEEMQQIHPPGFLVMCRDILAANPPPVTIPIQLFANF